MDPSSTANEVITSALTQEVSPVAERDEVVMDGPNKDRVRLLIEEWLPIAALGEESAREIFMTALQQSESDELWAGVFFDQYGRFDENMLIANISELPFEKRKAVLDEGLNTLLSVQLFEVSQHLDAAGKVDVFRFISDQKASLERVGA